MRRRHLTLARMALYGRSDVSPGLPTRTQVQVQVLVLAVAAMVLASRPGPQAPTPQPQTPRPSRRSGARGSQGLRGSRRSASLIRGAGAPDDMRSRL